MMLGNNLRFKVWHVPQVPMSPFEVEVGDYVTAKLIQNTLAGYDLFQYENNIKPDYANASGISVWVPQEQEWWDVDDESLDEIVEYVNSSGFDKNVDREGIIYE